MCSYNAVNGIPTCASPDFLTHTLRDMWNFTGFVVSDQGAIHDISNGHAYASNETTGSADAINAGCDVNDGTVYASNLADAVTSGLVSPSRVDAALVRFLTQRFAVGSFDAPADVPWTNVTPAVMNSAVHRALARDAAAQSMVLLNNSRRVLPLTLSTPTGTGTLASRRTLLLLGPFADNGEALRGGKPDYETGHYVTYTEGLAQHPAVVAEGFGVVNVSVTSVNGPVDAAARASIAAAVARAQQDDVAVVLLAVGTDIARARTLGGNRHLLC